MCLIGERGEAAPKLSITKAVKLPKLNPFTDSYGRRTKWNLIQKMCVTFTVCGIRCVKYQLVGGIPVPGFTTALATLKDNQPQDFEFGVSLFGAKNQIILLLRFHRFIREAEPKSTSDLGNIHSSGPCFAIVCTIGQRPKPSSRPP